jgi:hypothetical protein
MEHLGPGWVFPPCSLVLTYESFSIPSELPIGGSSSTGVLIPCDAPPNSLINSILSLKVKTMEGEGAKIHSLMHSTSRVEGHVEALGCGVA